MTNLLARKCMHCRQRTVVPTILPDYTRDLEHDGRTYSVSLRDFHVLQCSNCAAIVLDNAANERISNALRSTIGLMLPADIKHRGESLGLTQKGSCGVSVR